MHAIMFFSLPGFELVLHDTSGGLCPFS